VAVMSAWRGNAFSVFGPPRHAVSFPHYLTGVRWHHSRSERMSYDPAARSVQVNPHPHDPRTYPDAGLRAAWLLGALFVVLLSRR
jgi:hypothetical protein